MLTQLKRSRIPSLCAAMLFACSTHAQCHERIVPNNPGTTDIFGDAVAISGNHAVVGARGKFSIGGDANSGWGAAYVFVRENGAWALQSPLTPSNTLAGQQFGASVAIDGDYAVVGAVQDATFVSAGGAAFVFKRSGTTWTQTAKLIGNDTSSNDFFGQSVAIDGDTIVVGAFRAEEVLPKSESGAAYVFRRNPGNETWAQEAKLLAPDAATADWFGYSVTLSNETLAIGAPYHELNNPGAFANTGAVYIFTRENTTWSLQEILLSNHVSPFGGDVFFGWDVSLQDDRLLVGAPGDDGLLGSAYIVERNGGVWEHESRLVALIRNSNDYFGRAVSLDGDMVAVGVPFRESTTGQFDAGSVCVFKKYSIGWLQIDEVFSQLPRQFALHGSSVSIHGDFMISGAPWENGAFANAGAAYITAVLGPWCGGDREWLLPQSGFFHDSGNWVPDIPGPLNFALFNTNAAYQIDYEFDSISGGVKAVDGDVTLSLGGFEHDLVSLAGPSVLVGSLTPDEFPSLAIGGAQGGLLRNYSAMIGDTIGSNGHVLVAGPMTSWIMQGEMTVGYLGHGLLHIDNGALVTNRNAAVGQQAGSSGEVIVQGDGTAWNLDFLLTVDNGSVTVGENAEITAGIVGFFGGMFLYPNGILDGDGTVNATIVNFGTVNPGSGTGTLSVNGDYAQVGQLPNQGSRSGLLGIDIAGSTPAVEHDLLQVQGQASLGGGLFVSLAPDTVLNTSQAPMEILHASSINPNSPTFDVAFLPALEDLILRVNYPSSPVGMAGSGSVTLSVHTLSSLLSFNQGTADPEGTPTAAVVGDFNVDGLDDLAITLTNGPSLPGTVVVMLSSGNGGFITPITHYTVGIEPSAIRAGRFDDNASLDLAVANQGNGIANGDVMILVNDGNGAFTGLGAPIVVGVRPSSIAAGAFGFGAGPGSEIDLLVANAGSNNLMMLENNGSGLFAPVGAPVPVGATPVRVDPGDLDNDRDLDAVVINASSNTIMILQNNGAGGFVAPVQYAVGNEPTDMVVVDLNNDTFIDVVTANRATGSSQGTISVLVNTGDLQGTLAPAVNLNVGHEPLSLVAAKLDHPGDPKEFDFDDLAVLIQNNGVPLIRILRNDTVGTALALTLLDDDFLPPVPDGAVALVTGDLDGVNGPDLITINAPPVDPFSGGRSGPQAASLKLLLNHSNGLPCASDIAPPGGGDQVVDVSDLLMVINNWGGSGAADISGDGIVNVTDLLAVINAWGLCP